MEIVVLRLGHRPERDQRVTTHVGLVGRALGAKGMLLAANDQGIERSITKVTKQWGGNFFVKTGVNWRAELASWRQSGGKVCHLTMYGENILEVIPEIRAEMKKENAHLMVVVGAEKVPFEVFEAADWNVAVSNQPHSEVAALALLLDHLHEGRELKAVFEHAELQIVPKKRGKEVIVTKRV
ncbi:MAG: tRNA (cytidine(56)-2'-O)-methyltransferase [Methanophagales archaeon ANME-1-THS]|nr:MAG: tRNA (cytidine(56)-2'-O)-methyltransferase [Methanophagales archaeon ANME-1-THS]